MTKVLKLLALPIVSTDDHKGRRTMQENIKNYCTMDATRSKRKRRITKFELCAWIIQFVFCANFRYLPAVHVINWKSHAITKITSTGMGKLNFKVVEHPLESQIERVSQLLIFHWKTKVIAWSWLRYNRRNYLMKAIYQEFHSRTWVN